MNPAVTDAEVTVYTCPVQKPLTLKECLEFRLSADKLMGQMLMASAQLKVNGRGVIHALMKFQKYLFLWGNLAGLEGSQ